MRVIITARQSLAPSYAPILARLVGILGEISKNPSNPKFNQYCFESLSALIRFVAEADPASVPAFESHLLGPAEFIISQDIAEFVPYILQILAQLLELHTADQGLPPAYAGLLGPLLQPLIWEQKGNVPALVRVWKPILARGGQGQGERQVQGLLGVFQRLMGSRNNDVWGLEIVQNLYELLPL
jgi:exportin-2 (importin alpha re-exporter)